MREKEKYQGVVGTRPFPYWDGIPVRSRLRDLYWAVTEALIEVWLIGIYILPVRRCVCYLRSLGDTCVVLLLLHDTDLKHLNGQFPLLYQIFNHQLNSLTMGIYDGHQDAPDTIVPEHKQKRRIGVAIPDLENKLTTRQGLLGNHNYSEPCSRVIHRHI